MKPPRTAATPMPPETPADSLQGQGAVSAMGVAATSEMAPVLSPQPERELAVLPLVETGPGAALQLSLVRSDGSRISVLLGTGEAIAIAVDLLQAARVRMGRGDWPGMDK